jgi:hypothetical protein
MKKYIVLAISGLCFTNIYANGNIESQDIIHIPPHSRSNAENIKNQKFCEQMGGIDISDDSNMSMSKDTIDAGSCKIVNNDKYRKYNEKLKSDIAKGIINNIVTPYTGNIENIAQYGSWYGIAPRGTVYGQYRAYAIGVFNNLVGSSSIELSIPNDRCDSKNEGSVHGGNSQMITWAACGAWSGGSIPAYAIACYNGDCVQDVGYIIHQY